MINEIAIEREHKRKSSTYTLIIHLVILLLAFFSTCEYQKAVDNQYSVAINFEEIIPPKLEEMTEASNSNKGSEAEGAARKKADRPAEILDQQTKTIENNRPEVKLPKPTPVPPSPTTDPVISETTIDDESDVTAAEDDIELDEPEMEEVPDPIETDVVTEEDVPPAKEEATESIKDRIGKILDVFKTGGSDDNGNPNGDPSSKDGSDSGTGKGDKGTGRGSDSSGNDGGSGQGTGGSGTGKYDGSGNGIFGRKVIKRNFKEVLSVNFENQENKKIVAKVCINRAGNVSYAELLNMETTAEIPAGKEKQVLKGIYGYKYEPNRYAPTEECGKLTITLVNISALTGN